MNCPICNTPNYACGSGRPHGTPLDGVFEVVAPSHGPRVRVRDRDVVYGMRLSRANEYLERHPGAYIIGGAEQEEET